MSGDSENPTTGPVSLRKTSHPRPQAFLPPVLALSALKVGVLPSKALLPSAGGQTGPRPSRCKSGSSLTSRFRFLARRALTGTWRYIAAPAPKGGEDWTSSCL